MRRRGFVGMMAAAAVLVGIASASVAGSGHATAAEVRPVAFSSAQAADPFALTGYRWIGRATLPVYSNWDGGTCVLDGTDFSGPASSSVNATFAAQLLQASIDDINAQLRGGLTLVNGGPVSHSDVCTKSTARPIVIGWGTIPETGRTMSYGLNASSPGVLSFQYARIVVTNSYNFACAGVPMYRDVQHVFTHELLHALGVGHSQDASAIMTAVSTACQSQYLLQPDDVSALAALYPPVLAPTPTPVATATPTATGLTVGVFAAVPQFSVSGQALAVFSGGTVDQLLAAAQSAGASGVWAQDASGAFQLLVVNGPAFLKNAFLAKFPSGFVGATAVTLVR